MKNNNNSIPELDDFMNNLTKDEKAGMENFAYLLTKFLAKDHVQAEMLLKIDELRDSMHEINDKLLSDIKLENETRQYINLIEQIKTLLEDFKKEKLEK